MAEDSEREAMKCYLCGSEELAKITEQIRSGPGVALYCPQCELGMLEHLPSDLSEFYDGEYRRQFGPEIGRSSDYAEIFESYVHYQSRRIELLRPWLTPGARLLEVGCSTGHFLYNVKELVKEAVGVDYDSAAAEYAAKICRCQTFGCGLDQTGLPHGSFDMVCAMQTMEHVEDPIAFARLLGRYLRPDGTIYIEVPSLSDPLLSIYDNQSYRHFFFHKAHLFYMTARSLMTVMNRAGFTGRIFPLQDYNFINHLHWVLTGKPQPTCHDGLGKARLPLADGVPDGLGSELEELFNSTDEKYKSILMKYGTTENIAFVGTFSSLLDTAAN